MDKLRKVLADFSKPFGRIDSKTVAVFLEQFALMIESGLAPGSALDGLTEQQEDLKFARVLEDMNQKIHTGHTISSAMNAHGDVFPATTVMLVRAGEEGGDIGSRLRRAGQLMHRNNQFASKIKGALTSPLITAGTCGVVLFFIVNTIFPKFIAMYDDMDLEFPAISRFVFSVVQVINHPLTWFALFLALVGAVLFRKTLEQVLFNVFIQMPYTQPFLGKLLCAGMCETIAFLHKDGVPLHRVLQMIVSNSHFKSHTHKLEQCKKTLVTTGSLAEAVQEIHYFPPVFHSMVSVGEEAGSLDALLAASQRMMEEEVELVVEQITTVLEPMVICVMGASMAVLFVGMFLPIYGMLNNLGG